MTAAKDNFSISTDKLKLDLSVIHNFLSHSYWSENIPFETVKKSIEGSMCFGVYDNSNHALPVGRQVGFARMVTDNATFAYLADVFIIEEYRGRGLSKRLMEFILTYPDLQGLRRILLATKDAHSLYKQFGFMPLNNPERFMHIHNPDIYKNAE